MPGMPEARSNLGLAYHLQKKYEAAIEQFQAALRQNPRLLAAKVFLGIDLYLTSRPVRAIAELEGARDLDPGNPLARKWLAMSYVQTGRYTHAIRELKDCRRLDPSDPEVVFHLGRVFRMLSTEAFLAVRSAGLESPWYFLLRGQKFTRQGDSRNALEELRHAARIAPDMRASTTRLLQSSTPKAALGRHFPRTPGNSRIPRTTSIRPRALYGR